MLRSIITLSLAGLCTAAGHKGTVSWVAGTGATPEITTVTAGESHVSTGQAWVNVPDWLADANVHTLVGHTTAGNTLRLDCPATADDRPCHFTFVYYFCPPCGVSTNGGLPPLFGANEFTGGSCAARYVATSGGDKKDTVFWTKVLTSGSFLELELSEGLEHASVWDVSNGQCMTQVTPTLLAVNAYHSSGPGANVIDGSLATHWNAGHHSGWNVPNWATFDFGAPQLVTSFTFYSNGDVSHDVKNWELQVSATGTGGWTTVASGVGVSGSDAEQTTTFDGAVSQFWRFYIPTRHTGYQAYVREVVFHSSHACDLPVCVNRGPAPPRVCLPCLPSLI